MRYMNTPDAPAAYRVVLDRLRAGSVPYQTEYFGPYAALGSAKGQETKILKEERENGRKARARIEQSPLAWASVWE